MNTHPYWGVSFAQFFVVLLRRLHLLVRGQLGWQDLSPDEVQLGVFVLLALSAACIGTFLVVTKMTMLANALSHTLLLGLAIAFFFSKESSSLAGLSLPALMLAAFISLVATMGGVTFFHRLAQLEKDASIGLAFTLFFALGVLLVNLTARYSHLGVEAVMGNADALDRQDLLLAFLVFLSQLFGLFFLFKRWKIRAFDESFARNVGIPVFIGYPLLLFQTATAAMASFRAVGVFVFLALLIVPVVIARTFVHSLKKVGVFSALIGLSVCVVSVALARHLLSVHAISVSTAGVIGMLLFFSLGAATSIKKLKEKGPYFARNEIECREGER